MKDEFVSLIERGRKAGAKDADILAAFFGAMTETKLYRGKRMKDGHCWGEKHPQSKLTWEKVAAIRAIPKPLRYGQRGELAAMFGVSRDTINSVRQGNRWKL